MQDRVAVMSNIEESIPKSIAGNKHGNYFYTYVLREQDSNVESRTQAYEVADKSKIISHRYYDTS
jgi:hypothetical protein